MRFLPSLAALALAACAVPTVSVQPRYGRPEISGTAGFVEGGVGGEADLEQAGLDDDEAISVRGDVDFGSPRLVVLAQAPRFEGTGTLDVTLTDGTNTITAGADVDSLVELGIYDAALVFDLIPGDTLELALGFGAAYLDSTLEFEDLGTGTVVRSEEDAPVPLLAAAASVWLGPVEVAAFAAGMDYTLDDDSVWYLDADAYARLKLIGGDRLRISLLGGYRLTQLELEYDDDGTAIGADVEIRGPYVGVEVSL